MSNLRDKKNGIDQENSQWQQRQLSSCDFAVRWNLIKAEELAKRMSSYPRIGFDW
jgi:hypothetical protein